MNMKTKATNRQGFSLVELLVVSTIMIVVSSIALVSFRVASRNARDGKRQADVAQVRAALELYRAEYMRYPIHTEMSNLINEANFRKYLSTPQVQDPTNVAPHIYTYSSNGSVYTVCYTSEATGAQTCRNNP
jgi:general secretion pathway protein G